MHAYVRNNLYVCMYVCMYVYVSCVCALMHTYVIVCVYVLSCMRMCRFYAYLCDNFDVRMYAMRAYMCMYVFMFMYMRVCLLCAECKCMSERKTGRGDIQYHIHTKDTFVFVHGRAIEVWAVGGMRY
jgi:hypothetical protein